MISAAPYCCTAAEAQACEIQCTANDGPGHDAPLVPMSFIAVLNPGAIFMTIENAYLVKQVTGWQETEDREHVLIGFELASEQKFALALNPEGLIATIATSLAAVDAFPASKMAARKVTPLAIDWVEAGEDRESSLPVVSFRLAGGGSLSVAFDRTLAHHIVQTLSAILGADATTRTPGMTKQ